MKTKNELIYNFLESLETEIEINNCIVIDEIDKNDPYTSIYQMIDENGGFDVEIIYYSNAIEYLKENDPSLRDSLEIASEYGYEVQNLNSEILASLLASKLVRDEFDELESEINDFFEELEEEEEE